MRGDQTNVSAKQSKTLDSTNELFDKSNSKKSGAVFYTLKKKTQNPYDQIIEKDKEDNDQKIAQVFTSLVKNRKAPLPSPGDIIALKKNLYLADDFTFEDLDRSNNAAQKALEIFFIDDFRAGIIRRYLEVGYNELKKILLEKEKKDIELNKNIENIGQNNFEFFRKFVEDELDTVVPKLKASLAANNAEIEKALRRKDFSPEKGEEYYQLCLQNQIMEKRVDGLDLMHDLRRQILRVEEEMVKFEQFVTENEQNNFISKEGIRKAKKMILDLERTHQDLFENLFSEYQKYTQKGVIVNLSSIVERDKKQSILKKINLIDEIEINDLDWSAGIDKKQFEKAEKILKKIDQEEKSFEGRKSKFISLLLNNPDIDSKLKKTISVLPAGFDKKGNVVALEIRHLEKEYDRLLYFFIKKLERMFSFYTDLAGLNYKY